MLVMWNNQPNLRSQSGKPNTEIQDAKAAEFFRKHEKL